MRRRPWHWPNHLSLFPLSAQNSSIIVKEAQKSNGRRRRGSVARSIKKSYVRHDVLDWKEFVDRPLYLRGYHDDDGEKLQKDGATTSTASGLVCQKGYAPKTISPCRRNVYYVPNQLKGIPSVFLRHLPFAANDPVYDKNTTNGKPFENLLQLRAMKVKNFLSIPERWELAGIGFIQYDSLLGNGLKPLVEDISRALGINSNDNDIACPSLPHFEKSPYNLTVGFRDWITNSALWDVESLIGYHRRQNS